MESSKYLSVLNEEQKEAVIHEGSPLLILAGAGSGKTRVITTKIAYLIQEKHIKPSSILAVTFTKKAAAEMKERASVLEPLSVYSQIRTFHSWGAYFLRQFYAEAGLEKNFTVYDENDTASLIMKAMPGIKKKEAHSCAREISLAKDYCLSPDSPDLALISDNPIFLSEVYKAYEERLHSTGNVDFGDLIYLPYKVLSENEEIRRAVQRRYRVIMVDEYQDSNIAQFKLLEQLACTEGEYKNYICVVGDDDQSIYKFRGADVRNILNFQKVFNGTQLIRLQTNYRSTQEILSLADSVVQKNTSRLGKTLVSARGKGKKPTLIFLPTQDDETEFCADLIQNSVKNGASYSSWAILYRTNAQSLGFETEFLHKKIPYIVVGTLKFYEREEIKDTIAWLSFLQNPRDELSWRRIINKPVRGIGEKTQDKIIDEFRGKNIAASLEDFSASKKTKEGIDSFLNVYNSLYSVLPSVPSETENTILAKDALSLSDEEGGAVTEATTSKKSTAPAESAGSGAANADSGTAASKRKKNAGKTLGDFLKAVIEKSGLEEYHREQDESGDTQKLLNLEELVNSASLYPYSKEGLTDFLDHINLDRTLETEEDKQNTDRVVLITLHNTKGLEFDNVVITGIEHGIFPREGKDEEELEEERRLFYVGVTRAKNELYLTSCASRRLYGRTNFMMPSPFLYEADQSSLRILGDKPSSFGHTTTSVSDPVAKKYSRGKQVYHDDYGYGIITKGAFSEPDENGNSEWVITVNFENSGIKKFIPKYQQKSIIVQDE